MNNNEKTYGATKSFTSVTVNPCKLCSPLGASLAVKGIAKTMMIIHGSQGCATYIRRYLISHFKEPVDIASSSFHESTAIFGGQSNLFTALDNVRAGYNPELIVIATSCLSETIGDDVPRFIREYIEAEQGKDAGIKTEDESASSILPPIITASTPSYSQTHAEGFAVTIRALVSALARQGERKTHINIFPGMVSCEDLRWWKRLISLYELDAKLLPDYEESLEGGPWSKYETLPQGGTAQDDIKLTGSACLSIECTTVLETQYSTASYLEEHLSVPAFRTNLPIGLRATDQLLEGLKERIGKEIPKALIRSRDRLLDAMADAHKYLFGLKAAVYGEEDLVIGLCSLLFELGITPVLAASGGNSKKLRKAYDEISYGFEINGPIQVRNDSDFMEIEEAVKEIRPDFILGHSKGYKISRQEDIPLIRVGFPIHDRFGGQRIGICGYEGALSLLDRIVNTVLEEKQKKSEVGYTYL